MKKLNKKGFTLIEMLVVIAIIAILVAIIVPTVTKANDKAKAATNAANLRTYAAELAIADMSGEIEIKADGTVAGLNGATPPTKPVMKAVGAVAAGDAAITVEKNNNEIAVKASGVTIDQLSKFADTGKWS